MDATTISSAMGIKLSLIVTGVRRARAITVTAGLMSRPRQAFPNPAPTAVVVPEPFHGSIRDSALSNRSCNTLFTNSLENPA